MWANEGDVGGKGGGHSPELSGSARAEGGGWVRLWGLQAATGGGHTGTRPGRWGAAVAVLVPRPDFGDDQMLSHMALEKAGKWPLGGPGGGAENERRAPRPSPACLLLPESPCSAGASAPGRSVQPVKAADCSGPITCLSGGQKSQGLVGFQEVSPPE